jgi:hypothetical protein
MPLHWLHRFAARAEQRRLCFMHIHTKMFPCVPHARYFLLGMGYLQQCKA